jgi:hypothetical protein
LGYKDKNKREIYEGDVIELIITKELMDKTQNTFFNSNLGKYIESHPNITSIVLAHNITYHLTMNYTVYTKVNGAFEYEDDKTPKILTNGEDSNFPIYLAQKGATYIGNVIENPYLIKQKPHLQKNDIFGYYKPYDYKGNVKYDGEAVVMDIKNNKIKAQYLRTINNGDGKIEELPLDEILENADLEYSPLTLKSYIENYNRYNKLYDNNEDAIEFYKKNFNFSDVDKEYLKQLKH